VEDILVEDKNFAKGKGVDPGNVYNKPTRGSSLVPQI